MYHDIVHGIKGSSIVIVDEMVGGIGWLWGHVDYCGGGMEGALLAKEEASVGMIGSPVEHGGGFTAKGVVETFYFTGGGDI